MEAFSYRGTGDPWRLERCEFELPPGNHAVVGVNGAGKSTLLALLAGILPGDVKAEADGVDLGGSGGRERQRWLGHMPQQAGQPRNMTVRDAISYSGWLKGLDGQDGAEAVERAMTLTDTADRASTLCRHLSGGTARRVSLACAVVHQPRVLLLDEPTAGLDPLQRDAFHMLLRESAAPYTLLATHLTEDVTGVADEVLVLSRGRLSLGASVEEAAGPERSPTRFTQFLKERLSE